MRLQQTAGAGERGKGVQREYFLEKKTISQNESIIFDSHRRQVLAESLSTRTSSLTSLALQTSHRFIFVFCLLLCLHALLVTGVLVRQVCHGGAEGGDRNVVLTGASLV